MRHFILLLMVYICFNAFGCKASEECTWIGVGGKDVTISDVDNCKSEIKNLSLADFSKLISWAIVTKNMEFIDLLIHTSEKQLIDANRIAAVDFTFLVLDSGTNSVDMLKRLEFERIDTVKALLNGKNLAYFAIETNAEELINYLVASPKYLSIVKQDINVLAAGASGNKRILEKLVDMDLNINTTDDKGCNVLDYAIARNNRQIKNYLTSRYKSIKPHCSVK
ncbi:Ankyrin repeats (3 copies) (plasmid) [Pseudoalteromonas sp. THAF3]|uniref:ankyrin repeat domain-containing protein n=1 Tax=Pseudoalteromonas sp. THAF3 TaxID=2587843 RepID=UPI001268B297|nr:hypothetical protein [Pseudoalteromonas sp. THAF3]QFU06944.1 Ankyrin repeats (3 copies) [Pseudoalteromonas sp. THAF3]